MSNVSVSNAPNKALAKTNMELYKSGVKTMPHLPLNLYTDVSFTLQSELLAVQYKLQQRKK
ncbi:hypothetical protein [Clostridium lacusfryxellense]|uniref:hypothetical protein n=1 Tax=Clostridium lacusfryxellense TaxID=205328 RepID=UPI001C0B44DE|nr:hypothetical protein [Clostridium lacusfryxellense]MBU3110141.1 hypothetical protein [Clostridium lacusfryxellense]